MILGNLLHKKPHFVAKLLDYFLSINGRLLQEVPIHYPDLVGVNDSLFRLSAVVKIPGWIEIEFPTPPPFDPFSSYAFLDAGRHNFPHRRDAGFNSFDSRYWRRDIFSELGLTNGLLRIIA